MASCLSGCCLRHGLWCDLGHTTNGAAPLMRPTWYLCAARSEDDTCDSSGICRYDWIQVCVSVCSSTSSTVLCTLTLVIHAEWSTLPPALNPLRILRTTSEICRAETLLQHWTKMLPLPVRWFSQWNVWSRTKKHCFLEGERDTDTAAASSDLQLLVITHFFICSLVALRLHEMYKVIFWH